jgi:leucine dehydrogenase
MTNSMIVRTSSVDGFERVLVGQDPETGLRAVIAIHDTTLGPALGGVRMRSYADEAAAIADCTELARAMTLKAAVAGLRLGGGWSVVIGTAERDKTEALLRAHGRFIATLDGGFIPVNDVGTVQADIVVIGQETTPVCAHGDPSPMTALGVREGIRAGLRAIGGDGDLAGVRICVQGVGNVGAALARLATTEGAEVVVADTVAERAQRVAASVGARVVGPDELLATECDVLAPCALGGIVNERTLPALACRIIAGGANNVLAQPELADTLAERGIRYAPDFCVNAGGMIFLEEQLHGQDADHAHRRVLGVGSLVSEVFARADRDNISTTRAATAIAEDRLRRPGPAAGP